MTMDLKLLADMIDEYIAAGQFQMLVYGVLIYVGILFAVTAFFFIFRAVGLYRINRRLGNKFAGLAFVPGLSGYALGSAADALKKKKPSNYCIHMMMLETFRLIVSAIYYYKTAERFVLLYSQLSAGGESDTLTLLQETMAVDRGDMLLFLSYYALTILGYAVTFVSLLSFLRILQLFRRGGFFMLILSIFVPEVMNVYLFVMRNKPLYQTLPVFRMPDGTTFDPSGTNPMYGDSEEDPYDPSAEDDRYEEEADDADFTEDLNDDPNDASDSDDDRTDGDPRS